MTNIAIDKIIQFDDRTGSLSVNTTAKNKIIINALIISNSFIVEYFIHHIIRYEPCYFNLLTVWLLPADSG